MEHDKVVTEKEKEDDETKPGSVLYGVEDVPSPPLCFLFGLQVTPSDISSLKKCMR